MAVKSDMDHQRANPAVLERRDRMISVRAFPANEFALQAKRMPTESDVLRRDFEGETLIQK
jgi:hypothetical protein